MDKTEIVGGEAKTETPFNPEEKFKKAEQMYAELSGRNLEQTNGIKRLIKIWKMN